jgi:hypothetical protein
MRRQAISCVFFLAILIACSAAGPALAATHTWTGATSSFWSDSSNWIGGSPAGDPVADLVFPAVVTRLTSTNDIPGVSYINSITFSAAGYNVGAVAGSSLALAGSISWSGTLSAYLSGQVTFAVPVTLYGGVKHTFFGNWTNPDALFLWSGKISGGASDGLGLYGSPGSATVQLTGTNDYTGPTRLDDLGGPTMQIDGFQPLSPVFVATTLRGSGTIGPLDLQAYSQNLQPGGINTGILSVKGDAYLSPMTTSTFRLNGPDPGTGYDQLFVDGSIFLTPALGHSFPANISLSVGFTPTIGQVFTIIKSTGPISGNFSIPDGYIMKVDCLSFRYNISTNEVTLTAVAASPPPITSVSISTSGSRTVCPSSTGGVVTVTDTGGCSGNTHQWGYRTTSGGAIANVPGQTLATYTINGADFPAPGSYYLVCTSTPPGGASVVSNELFVTVTPPPTAVASGSATICAGATAPLSGSGAAVCNWSPSTGLSDPNSCTPLASPTTSTTYSLVVTGASGCVSINTATASVTVKPTPSVPVVQTPATVGAGAVDQSASVDLHPGSTYQWSISNGTITAGATTSQITFTAGVAGTPLTLSVTETSALGCTSAAGTATVTVLPAGSAGLFYTVTPCRQLDTRSGSPISPGGTLAVALTGVPCGIPSGATSVSVNAVVTQEAGSGHLTIYPADKTQPLASTINFNVGQTRANNAILPLSSDGTGGVKIYNGSGGTVHVVIDVNGYFQ